MNGAPAPAPAMHRRLTPARAARGVLCLNVILSTAFMTLVFWAPPVFGLLRLVSLNRSRKLTSLLFGMWLALWPFLFEKINGTKVVFAGDKVPAKERVLLIANHRTEVDWMYLWDLALRKGRLGFLKYVLKSSLMKLPVFGWGFHVFEFVSVERKWEVDEPEMRRMLARFSDPAYPLWLAVFPEGTDYTEQKCIRSKKFALENDLPVLDNVLLPKTKGFYTCVEVLRNSLDAVYDLTIAYKHRCPSFMDNVFGVDPAEVHIHVRRILLDEIPADEEEASSWLMNTFLLKDKLLSDFIANGYFPHQGTEGELSTIKCLLNFFIVITATGFCTYFTVFSSFFKLYLVFSCLFLAIITRLKFWPSPICLGSFFCKKKSE